MSASIRKAWLAGVFLYATAASAGAQQVQVSAANRTIAITTTEEAERRADTAVVHIGYQLYGASSEQVTQRAAIVSKAITDAVAKAGVPRDAIESDGQGTGPVQDYQQQSPEDRAGRRFQAQQSWTVRTGAEAASRVLAAAVGAGANQSGAIEWSVADDASLSAEAAGKALKHAQAIAEQMAAGLSARLGPLVYASNEAQSLGRPVNVRAMQVQQMDAMDGPPRPPTLSLGAPMVRRSATVSAVFSLQ